MKNTLLKLRKELPVKFTEIIQIVVTLSEKLGIHAFIVGATARDLIFEYVYGINIKRATADIDFAVAVENWEQYEKLKQALIGTEKFRSDPKMEQRLWFGNRQDGMKIDLVPYGGIESPKGTVTFPPTEFEMNTSGFAESYRASLQVAIRSDLNVRVVSPAGLLVLKFTAFDDRPAERLSDLQDIKFMMQNYLEAGNEERLYSDAGLLDDEDFDLRTVGARLLGRDAAEILTGKTKTIIFKHLSEDENKITKTGLLRIAELMHYRERELPENIELITKMLRELKKGILEGKS